jgi:hypothetical protein
MTSYIESIDDFSLSRLEDKIDRVHNYNFPRRHMNMLLRSMDSLIERFMCWSIDAESDMLPTVNISVRGPKTKIQSRHWRSKVYQNKSVKVNKEWSTNKHSDKTSDKITLTETKQESKLEQVNERVVESERVITDIPIHESTYMELSQDNKSITITRSITECTLIDLEKMFPGKVVTIRDVDQKPEEEKYENQSSPIDIIIRQNEISKQSDRPSLEVESENKSMKIQIDKLNLLVDNLKTKLEMKESDFRNVVSQLRAVRPWSRESTSELIQGVSFLKIIDDMNYFIKLVKKFLSPEMDQVTINLLKRIEENYKSILEYSNSKSI